MKEKKKINMKFDILAIITILIFCFALCPKTLQNDTFYTIKIGERILTDGIDMQDHFSWHENLPYTYPHWAYDCVIYMLYSLGENSGIENGGMLFIYISTIVLACIMGVLIYQMNCKLTKNKLISYIITIADLYLLSEFIAARAQLVTFILFLLTILCIESFLESKKKTYLLWLVLISIAIANIHVAVWPFFFVLFMPYIAEYIIALIYERHWIQRIKIFNQKDVIRNLERKLEKQKDEAKKEKIILKLEEEKEKKLKYEEQYEEIKKKTATLNERTYKIKITKNDATKWLILVLIICAFTGLLTPLKDTPYTYLVKTMQGNTTENINEHLPLTLYKDKETMVILALIFAMLIFTDTKIKLSDAFMLGGLIYLAFKSRRQISMLLLIGVFAFAKLVTYIVQKYDKDGCKKFMKFMTTLLGKICTITFIVLFAFAIYKPKIKTEYIDTRKYPIAASDWILRKLNINEIKLFNEYNYGSYLLFRGIPVFIDSRADLYTPEFNGKKNDKGKYEGQDIFSDYIHISSISTYYENKFEKYGITHVLLTKNSKLNMLISRNSDYKMRYTDDNFVIYERKAN